MKGASLLLDGYITRGKPTQRVYNGKVYHIVHFQGKHANEFAIYETKDGVYDGMAELYKDGMLKIRWEMKNGKRDGLYVQYKKGLVIKKGRWKDVGADVVEERWVENRPGSIRMIITSFGKTVFIGGFDDNLEKNGYGIEFNPDGSPSMSGLYRHDKLVWLHQRMDSSSEMTEFAIFPTHNDDEYVEKDDCVFMHPEYTGSYLYNEDTNTIQRDGAGYLIDKQTGCCIAKSEWEKGVEVESKRVPLYDGWYCMTESPPSLRRVAEMEEDNASSFSSFLFSNLSEKSPSIKQENDQLPSKSPINELNTMGPTYREPFDLPPHPTSRPFSVAREDPQPELFYSHPEEPYYEQSSYSYPFVSHPQAPPGIPLPSSNSHQQPSSVHPSVGGAGRVLEPFTDFDPLPVPMEPIEPEKVKMEKPKVDKTIIEQLKEAESNTKEQETNKPEARPDTETDPYVFPSVLIPNVTTIETMMMPARSFSKPSYTLIRMSDIPTLKHITIGEDSFANVRTFSLSNLNALQSVKIGKRCCTLSKESPVQECVEGQFSIMNCPKLKTIFVGELAFSDYHFLDLSNLPALSSLTIADVCFKYGTYLELKCTLSPFLSFQLSRNLSRFGWVTTRSSTVRKWFWKVILLVASDVDLPSLQTVILGVATLECDGRDDRKSITMAPYSFFNTILMKSASLRSGPTVDLPSLNQLTGPGGNLSCVGTIELESRLAHPLSCRHSAPRREWHRFR